VRHSPAPAVVFFITLKLQDNHRPLRDTFEKFRVIKKVLIKLLDKEGMLFLESLVHGLLS
jgi:hypothetical protein